MARPLDLTTTVMSYTAAGPGSKAHIISVLVALNTSQLRKPTLTMKSKMSEVKPEPEMVSSTAPAKLKFLQGRVLVLEGGYCKGI